MQPVWRGIGNNGRRQIARYTHFESLLRGVMRALDKQNGDLKNMTGRQTCV
jgi:hypothetical protein